MALPRTQAQLDNLLKEAEMSGYFRGRQEEELAQKTERFAKRAQARINMLDSGRRLVEATEAVLKRLENELRLETE